LAFGCLIAWWPTITNASAADLNRDLARWI
jgi:hypothetical protein